MEFIQKFADMLFVFSAHQLSSPWFPSSQGKPWRRIPDPRNSSISLHNSDTSLHLSLRTSATLANFHNDLMGRQSRSEEHTSELHTQIRISYAVFCLQKTI